LVDVVLGGWFGQNRVQKKGIAWVVKHPQNQDIKKNHPFVER
tara:strand:+ start:790 stop:915 length:126 start_codon:yes stop_codon:yes gene_type:complete